MARYGNRPTVTSCVECGASLPPPRHASVTKDFCCDRHRKAFNNRRMLRGAELYDVFMSCRFSRAEAETDGAWNLMCRMAAAFKAQDHAGREGRRSWNSVREIRDRRPEYVATVVARGYRAGR